LLVAVLHAPGTVFKEIAAGNTRVIGAVQRLTFLFILMPPIFSWIGSTYFGWRLGSNDPLYFDTTARVIISFFYADALILGYISEDGIRDSSTSRGLGDVYKRQAFMRCQCFASLSAGILQCADTHSRGDVVHDPAVSRLADSDEYSSRTRHVDVLLTGGLVAGGLCQLARYLGGIVDLWLWSFSWCVEQESGTDFRDRDKEKSREEIVPGI